MMIGGATATAERASFPGWNMLRWRLLLGTIFIAALVGLFAWDHVSRPRGIVLLPLSLALCALAGQEYLGLLAARGLRPAAWLVVGGSLLVVAASAVPLLLPKLPGDSLSWPLAGFGLALLAAFAAEMWRYQRPGEVVERLALAVLGVAYAGLLLAFVVLMRGIGRDGDGSWGIPARRS